MARPASSFSWPGGKRNKRSEQLPANGELFWKDEEMAQGVCQESDQIPLFDFQILID
jgi:hypothetical protein